MAVKLGEPPATLKPAEAARWLEVAPLVATNGAVDQALLTTYCRVWVRWQEAEGAIAKAGALIRTSSGRATANPYIAVSKDASREAQRLERRLGLTTDRPASPASSLTDAGLLTRRELSERLQIHMQTITKWERDGLPIAERGRKGRASMYRLSEVVAWRSAREQAAAKPGGPIDVAQERARKERAQALLAEQLYATRSGKLLPADEVEKAWTAEVAAVRTLMLSAPTTWADRIHRAGTTDGLAGVERELKALIHGFLRELADRKTAKPRRRKATAA